MVLMLMTVLFSFQLGTRPISTPGYLIFLAVTATVFVLAYQMQTDVTNEEIVLRFGLLGIRKRIPFSRISTVREVRNPWYYGWGIRIIPNGWLYNISGNKAVELQLHSGKVLRIGTQKQTELASVIKELMTKRT